MCTEHSVQEERVSQIRQKKDGGIFARGPGSTYPPLPPSLCLLSHLELSGRRQSPRRFLSGKRRTTETLAHNALRVGRSQGRKWNGTGGGGSGSSGLSASTIESP